MTDPTVQAWRTAHATLGSRLVDLESHANVALARTGVLTGTSAAAWAEADTGLSHAWETYRVLDEVLGQAEAEPARAGDLLRSARVPGPDGATTDASTALGAASAAVDAAVALADRLAAAWDGLAPRVGAARSTAAAAGDAATERAATALAELVASDPLAVDEADVAAVERRAEASGGRRAAAQAAAARLDVDLAAARDALAALDADGQAAAGELAHAASRVAGVDASPPVPDLAGVGDWLDRIAATAAADRTRAAADLAAWNDAVRSRRADLDAALGAARAAMRRRAEGQGLWTALRAKAGARKVDERADVAEALAAARDVLWHAPCDLAAADAALARLTAALTARPGEDR
ncbi:MAG TPA: hypothetical protein VFZ77_18535 [Acidimicrobiales bacterium]